MAGVGSSGQQQVHDPALTVADTQALLAGDFPNMREFQAVVDPDSLLSYGSGFDAYCGDSMVHRVPMPSPQPGATPPAATLSRQPQPVCKAEPASPTAGGNGGGWVPVSDWAATAPYDSYTAASPFADCCGGYADMEAHFGLDTASWNAADEEGDFSQADLFPPTSISTIRTMPVDARPHPSRRQPPAPQPASEASDSSRLPGCALPRPPCSEGGPLGSPLGSPASGAASGGSDASAATAAAVSSGARACRGAGGSCCGSAASSGVFSMAAASAGDLAAAGGPQSASQRCAAALMPAIGGPAAPQPARRVNRTGGRPSDGELKETIATLQRTTPRVPGSSDEAHTITRAECLERYREKKLRRLDVNTIRYMKRKINADRRPRIKGRFVKAEELAAYHAGLLPGQGGCPP